MIINDDIFSLISHCFVTDSDKIEPRPLTIGSHFRFLQHKIWRHFHLSDLATFGTSSPHKEIPINDKVTPLSSTIFNGASPSNWKMMMLSKTHTLCQKTTFGPNIPFLVPLLVKIRIDFWHEKSLIRVTYFLGFWVEFCRYQKSTFWKWAKIGFLP